MMYFTDEQTTVVNGIVCNEQQNTRDNKRCKTVNGLAFFINLWGVIIGYNQCSKFIPFPLKTSMLRKGEVVAHRPRRGSIVGLDHEPRAGTVWSSIV